MGWACVSNLHLLIGHSMLSVCCTCVDSVDVVNAAADGVLLDDSYTHLDVVGFEVGRVGKVEALLVDDVLLRDADLENETRTSQKNARILCMRVVIEEMVGCVREGEV